MAVTNIYTASAIGDIIVFDSKIQLTQNVALTFADTVSGTTGTSYFTKNFRYALDGVHFTDWIVINQENLDILSSLLIEETQLIWLQFQYTYAGTVTGVVLTITAVSINSTSVQKNYVYNMTNQTIFGVYVNDPMVYDLMNNLSAKLFDLGIVPSYVERGSEQFALNVDEDYIDFWTSVAHYYALYFVYCMQFTDIFNQQKLLCEFLKEKTIFFCGCSDLTTLQLLAKNYYSEIRSRGTFEVFRKKGYQYPIGSRLSYSFPGGYSIAENGVMIDGIIYYDSDPINCLPEGWVDDTIDSKLFAPDNNYHQTLYYDEGTEQYDIAPVTITQESATVASGIFKQYDGEYLRLICFNDNCDEFFYVNMPLQYCGWNLNNSSPLYKGFRPIYTDGFIKAYENSFDFVSLTNYPIIGAPIIESESINYLNKTFPNAQTLALTAEEGLGFPDGTTQFNEKYALNISPNVDYEISFWFKQDTVNPSLELSALTYNCDFSQQKSTIDINTGNDSRYFIKGSADQESLYFQGMPNPTDIRYKITSIGESIALNESSNFSLNLLAGSVLEWIVFDTQSAYDFELFIGTTPGGNDILDVTVYDRQPIQLLRYAKTNQTLYFSGILNSTYVVYNVKVASSTDNLTATGNFTIGLSTSDVLTWILFDASAGYPFTLNVGTTLGGSDILSATISDDQPINMLQYAGDSFGGQTLYFSGIPNPTFVAYRIIPPGESQVLAYSGGTTSIAIPEGSVIDWVLFDASTGYPFDLQIGTTVNGDDILNSEVSDYQPIQLLQYGPSYVGTSQQIVSQANTWYFARYCLYRSSQSLEIGLQPRTSLGAGTNLILDAAASKLIVGLICTQGNVNIWNFKIKPLKADFSFCFLDTRSLFFLFLKNNNNNLSVAQVQQIAARYLLPYDLPQSNIVLLN
jgi:hypothetical protein